MATPSLFITLVTCVRQRYKGHAFLHFRGIIGDVKLQQYYVMCTLPIFFLVFVVSCKGLTADRSPIEGILLTYYKQDSETQKMRALGPIRLEWLRIIRPRDVQNNSVACFVELSIQYEIGIALPVSTLFLTSFISLNLLRRAQSWSDRNSGSCSLSACTSCWLPGKRLSAFYFMWLQSGRLIWTGHVITGEGNNNCLYFV
jgi:hypothetical protein